MKKLLFCALLLLSNLSFATAINEDNFLIELEGSRFNHGAAVNSVAWLACGGKKYIALGGDTFGTGATGIKLRLLEFDPFTNITKEITGGVDFQPTTGDFSVNSVAWLNCDGKKYLAVGSDEDDNANTRFIYRLSESNMQLQQRFSSNNLAAVNSVAWIDCGSSGKFLAEGIETNSVAISSFNLQTESLVDESVEIHGAPVNSVAWCIANNKKFLAIGGEQGTGMFTTRLYLFDPNGPSLTLQTGGNQMHGGIVNAVDWVDCNGTKYLATGGNTGTDGFHVRVYRLDADIPSLTDVAQFNSGSGVVKINWLNCGGTKYLATVDTNGVIRVLKFDATEDSELLTEAAQVADIFGRCPVWLQCGALIYLATGGTVFNSITNRVFEVDFNDDAINKLLREKFFQLHGNNAPDVPFLEPPVIIV